MNLFMNKKDFYSGLVFLLFSVAFIVLILKSPSTYDSSEPGPFFFPAIAAVFIGALSLTLLVRGVQQPGVPSSIQAKRMWGRIFWIIFWCGIYAATIEKLGYLLSTGVVTFALLAYFYRGRWALSVILSVTTPILIHFLFDTLLKVSMPKGWFGF